MSATTATDLRIFQVSEPIGENEKNQGTSDQPDEFTCPVCLDVFYHPYNCKPCNHTFCGPCLRRLAAANAANALSTKCPLCRKLIDVCQPNYGKPQRVTGNDKQCQRSTVNTQVCVLRTPSFVLKKVTLFTLFLHTKDNAPSFF